MAFIRTIRPERIGAIGVLGASQGGAIAPIVATQSDDVAFAISLVGGVVPFDDALVYEEIHDLRQMGFLPGVSDAIARVSSSYIRKFAQRDFSDAIGDYDALDYWARVDVPALRRYESRSTGAGLSRRCCRIS